MKWLLALMLCLLFGCGTAGDDGSEESSSESEHVEDSEATSTDINIEVDVNNGDPVSEG